MNTRQSRIILFALLVVSVGAFSQVTARGLTDATQPVVEATTKAVACSGCAGASSRFDYDGTPRQMPPQQKPTRWWESWWEWLRFAGGGR